MATDFIMPRMPTASSRDAFYQPAQQPQQQQPQLITTSQPPPLSQPYPHQAAYGHAAATAAHATAASNFASQYNPQISPLSTSNNGSSNSPSPKSAYHTRQVRPLYIPAVLRPTEFPSRQLPASKKGGAADGSGGGSAGSGGSGSGSGDDGAGAGAVGSDDDLDDEAAAAAAARGLRSSGSFISLPGLGAFGIGRLSRRSTNDSGKCVDSSWNLDLFPEVQGLPSRSHWKPDPESTMCDEPTCKKTFNYFTRRHHCRRCGNIFCDLHSAYEIPLDEKANYNPRGTPNRACAYCFRDFRAWRSRTHSRDLSAASLTPSAPTAASGSGSTSASSTPVGGSPSRTATAVSAAAAATATAPTSPVMAHPGRPGGPGTPTLAKVPDVAQSVPGNWNWSTF